MPESDPNPNPPTNQQDQQNPRKRRAPNELSAMQQLTAARLEIARLTAENAALHAQRKQFSNFFCYSLIEAAKNIDEKTATYGKLLPPTEDLGRIGYSVQKKLVAEHLAKFCVPASFPLKNDPYIQEIGTQLQSSVPKLHQLFTEVVGELQQRQIQNQQQALQNSQLAAQGQPPQPMLRHQAHVGQAFPAPGQAPLQSRRFAGPTSAPRTLLPQEQTPQSRRLPGPPSAPRIPLLPQEQAPPQSGSVSGSLLAASHERPNELGATFAASAANVTQAVDAARAQNGRKDPRTAASLKSQDGLESLLLRPEGIKVEPGHDHSKGQSPRNGGSPHSGQSRS